MSDGSPLLRVCCVHRAASEPAARINLNSGVEMIRMAKTGGIALLGACVLAAVPAGAQSFGAAKEKVTLHRKLPALVHLAGSSVKVIVPGSDSAGDVSYDLQALLETEILKDDPALRIDPNNPDNTLVCSITSFNHPPPEVTTRPSVTVVGVQNQDFTRITGSLEISFQVKDGAGRQLIADNVKAKYDEEFDALGNATSKGVKGTFSGTFKRLKGGSSEEMNAPTDAELRSKLLLDAVQQIAEHIVNTDEAIDVFLARQKGAMEDGDKAAEGGLWERALETFETAPPMSKPEEDAYRLYDIGVAYEALAYQAEDDKAAMKYLDQAAINYGKAIDAKPSEKYFVAPQNRIETAIAHYKELEEEKKPKPAPVVEAANVPPSSTAAGKPSAPKALTNTQVVAMIKSGMDDDTVIQAVRAAKIINFDLTPAGQQQLTTSGVSAPVIAAMKARAARKPPAAGTKSASSTATTKPASQ